MFTWVLTYLKIKIIFHAELSVHIVSVLGLNIKCVLFSQVQLSCVKDSITILVNMHIGHYTIFELF